MKQLTLQMEGSNTNKIPSLPWQIGVYVYIAKQVFPSVAARLHTLAKTGQCKYQTNIAVDTPTQRITS